MAIAPLKLALFLAGAAGVVGGTAYYAGALDPYLTPPAQVAALPAADASKTTTTQPDSAAKPAETPPAGGAQTSAAAPAANGTAATQPAGEPAKVAAVEPDAAKPAAATAAPSAQPPTFDVLRVEPDGSMVIAGNATPGSTVEIIAGSKTLAKVAAGPGGDFAAALDEPLKPGDYQIVLRSTGPASVAMNSEETAVVSVPETKDGQVLALVEKPGAPSKLITAPAPEKPADTVAAAPSTTAPAATPTQPAAVASAPKVGVEAVEIEGRKIFVAGPAPAGSTVRVYAGDILLGDAKASPDGRFLIEAERDLKVGDYIIRADVVGPDGNVLARAAVPFEREAGEAVAAVAPGAGQPAADQNSTSQPGAAATSAADANAKPAGTATQPSTGTAQASTPAAQTGQSAAATAPASGTAAAQPAASGEAASTAQPAPDATQQSAAAQPATEATAPKLQASQSGVIIRRGDTLWRISKRVYGRGTRYSTIYVANKDQIEDPDRIWPGQVFRVPDKSDRGEAADMKAIEGQATTVR